MPARPQRPRPSRWGTVTTVAVVAALCASCTPSAAVTGLADAPPTSSSATSQPDASTDVPATAAIEPTSTSAVIAPTSTADAAAATTIAPSSLDACSDPQTQALGTGWNFVVATAPLAGEHVQTGFRLRGCGDVFEASFGWRLRDASGGILVEDFAMMSCGTGCVGTFDLPVAYPPVAEPSLGSLEVYTTSMNDGAEMIRGIIPVILH